MIAIEFAPATKVAFRFSTCDTALKLNGALLPFNETVIWEAAATFITVAVSAAVFVDVLKGFDVGLVIVITGGNAGAGAV
jgi:hypothetical protein